MAYDRLFVAAALQQAEEASTRREREAALSSLERADEVAKAIRYLGPSGESLATIASTLKRKLEEERRKAEKEAAELVEKCTRVGQAEQIVAGETPQQLWLCENGWVVKVQDESGVIAELQMPLDEADPAERVTDAFLQDLVGDSIPEVVVAVEDMCASTGVAVFGWEREEQMKLLWYVMNSVSCMDGDLMPDSPIAPTVKDGVVLWSGQPMIWEAESESFVLSPAGLAGLREQQIQKAKELLRQGRAGPAFAALPDDPPTALAKKIAAGCQRYYLKALSELRPEDEWGQPVGKSGFRDMKVEVLEDGVKCAPNSATLKRKLSQFKRQIQVEEQRAAARQAKIERQKQLAAQREAQRRKRELLGKVHGSGWTCGSFAFRLLSNGRAKLITRDWDGSVDYASGTFEAKMHGSQLDLRFLKQGRLRVSIYISQVSPQKITYTSSPGARIGSWCEETSRI
jgi:hypothetical protein